jgi:hypothetical protein
VLHTFVHEAFLSMAPGNDIAAPGAAITVELCGDWEHEPPCPLAPHHTQAERLADEVRVRTVFAAEPDREAEVRERIGAALASGRLVGPDGRESRWRRRSDGPSAVRADEQDHARRLARA